MKVLIAEDTESVRFALRLAVEFLGHEVVGMARDGAEALAEYKSKQPELVLMDARMPNMDGLTCTSLLAQQDPQAKIVIVTGGRATEREARQAGARAYVEKPFDLWHLGNVMHSLARA
jgi:DNA-binding NarL/FixJ family response regulator